MELSSRLINKLKQLSDDKKFSVEFFKLFISKAFETFSINESLNFNFDFDKIGNFFKCSKTFNKNL